MPQLIYPSLVLVQPRKTRPYITERLLMRRKESKQTKTNKITLKETATLIASESETQALNHVIFNKLDQNQMKNKKVTDVCIVDN